MRIFLPLILNCFSLHLLSHLCLKFHKKPKTNCAVNKSVAYCLILHVIKKKKVFASKQPTALKKQHSSVWFLGKLQLQRSRFTYATSPSPHLPSWHSEMYHWIFIKPWACIHGSPLAGSLKGCFQIYVHKKGTLLIWCIYDRVSLCKYLQHVNSTPWSRTISLKHSNKTKYISAGQITLMYRWLCQSAVVSTLGVPSGGRRISCWLYDL